jgi:quinol monooxygenase YgiN
MGQIVVVARARVQEGREEEMGHALLENAAASRKEPGCVSYWVLRGDGGLFMTVERWRSRIDVEQHMATPHVARLFETITPWLASEPELTTAEEL